MPTYDYLCEACQHQFEEFQSMSDKLLRKCPECGKNALKRLIGPGSGVIFKGSGFYQTDYKRSSADSKPSGESSSPPSTPKPDKPAKKEKPKDS